MYPSAHFPQMLDPRSGPQSTSSMGKIRIFCQLKVIVKINP